MINLIPPYAKKKLKVEYWARVVSVWFVIWSLALLAGVAILFPAYVLISVQIDINQTLAAEASEKVATYETVSKDLVRSSQESSAILGNANIISLSTYFKSIKSLQGGGISFKEISVNKTVDGLSAIKVTGDADTRQNLASFRERLLQQGYIKDVNLPISNLAKDRDISFSLTIDVDNQISP